MQIGIINEILTEICIVFFIFCWLVFIHANSSTTNKVPPFDVQLLHHKCVSVLGDIARKRSQYVIHSVEMRRFCARPQMEIRLKIPAGVIFCNFQIFAKSSLFLYFKCVLKVLDWNLKAKWYNLDDIYSKWQ